MLSGRTDVSFSCSAAPNCFQSWNPLQKPFGGGGFKTDTTHDRVLGISVIIPDLRQISHMTVY